VPLALPSSGIEFIISCDATRELPNYTNYVSGSLPGDVISRRVFATLNCPSRARCRLLPDSGRFVFKILKDIKHKGTKTRRKSNLPFSSLPFFVPLCLCV